MNTGPAKSFVVEHSIQQRLAGLTNDYANASSIFNYAGVHLVDTIGLAKQTNSLSVKAREAAHHAFLEYPGDRDGVSIVIPTFGEPELLSYCLESIARQTLVNRHPNTVQVIVIEDGVKHGSRSVFDFPLVLVGFGCLRNLGVRIARIQLRENKGRSIARNIGVDAANGQIVVFVDNSMILDPRFLVEHMMRHAKVRDAIALLGFKQNICIKEYIDRSQEIKSGAFRPDFSADIKINHILGSDGAPFEFNGRSYAVGDRINYMELTNYLASFPATVAIGRRTLPTFFQTNVASVRRQDVLRAGGFEPTLKLWGFEDSLLGARLIALANCRLIPCPSAVAFNVEATPTDAASKQDDIDHNRSVYENALNQSIAVDYVARFRKSLEGIRSKAKYLDETEMVKSEVPNPVEGDASGEKKPSSAHDAFSIERAEEVAHRIVKSGAGASISVTRRELTDLIATTRLEAGGSVTNLSGDLSWAAEELAALRAVIEKNPLVQIRFFYDRTRVSKAMLPTLMELHNMGVYLRPYPTDITPGVRCMLIDDDDVNDRHVVWFSRAETPPKTPRSEHKFIWHQAGVDAPFIVDSISALVRTFERFPRQPFRVGVCGLNNVGKTAFVRALKERLNAKKLDVHVVNDIFRELGPALDVSSNYAMLASQLNAENSSVDCDVVIFDRISLDNFAFLQMRRGRDKRQDPLLIPKVLASVRSFDLLLDVHRNGAGPVLPTRHVSAEQRTIVRATLDALFKAHHVRNEYIGIDHAEFEANLSREVARIGDLVEVAALTKRILPSN